MRTLTIFALLAVMACGSVTEPKVETINSMDNGSTIVQYIVLGDAYSVSLAFATDENPSDSLPCALLPLPYQFELNRGDTAFIRVHKHDVDDVVTVAIMIDGWFRVIDTARPGDPMAEVYWQL